MRHFFILLAVLCAGSSFAGNTDSLPPLKNVIVFDASGFARQFFNEEAAAGYYYNAPYLIGYRRYVGAWALRVGIGGNISAGESIRRDTILTDDDRRTFNIRCGVERGFVSYRRWSVYAGADVFYRYTYYYYRSHWGSSNQRASVTRTNAYGFTPLMGLIFQVNRHIGLSTELGLDVSYSRSETGEYDYSPTYGAKSSEGSSWAISTDFLAPQMLILRVNF